MLSIKSVFTNINEPINWERAIHRALHLSLWWLIYGFGYLLLSAVIPAPEVNYVVGLMLGLYLIGAVVETVLGAAFNDDNNPPNMSRLGRFLSKFQVRKPA